MDPASRTSATRGTRGSVSSGESVRTTESGPETTHAASVRLFNSLLTSFNLSICPCVLIFGLLFSFPLPSLFLPLSPSFFLFFKHQGVEDVTCPLLTPPTNGLISGGEGEQPVGSTASYSCDEDYSLEGSRQRTCRSDGLWSGMEPTCERTSSIQSKNCQKERFKGST